MKDLYQLPYSKADFISQGSVATRLGVTGSLMIRQLFKISAE